MAVLFTIAKRLDFHRPVVYRSHVDIRPDQVADPASPAAQVWDWARSHVKAADVFVSNPGQSVLTQVVPKHKLGYMVHTLDSLDGEFNEVCRRQCMPTLMYPGRDYIVQIASFEQSDGVADALEAYAAFRRASRFCARKTTEQPPQLVLCSPSSASSNSTDEMTGFLRAVTDRETLKELNESRAML
ncbi:hypothetical protein LTR91_025338 [Friedmanniomyces endolithicus]|uniref:Uncharacterized protein n=1 Tax=Friedmanniomyces endolithicus TaxID=329885 RepID=A0AAN6H027_9PEZI|nr:hypothetical protein LTR94_023649 [Friedmanniomyces endolithicus]KAK0769124.1 hypothetical protein LTR38_017967 [Friedmanniomyces endolithicus]KAK0890375.1 hypothetical protein LTR57_025138 [Friedmanniomyces endolithicus]KAK0950895.1 hypothetical protein LTR91_025338 [Friedmanniomyces endolithicus]KAK1021539.1 hypothetical protein LTS16_026438 [Friedmanniomyces endolithicus]